MYYGIPLKFKMGSHYHPISNFPMFIPLSHCYPTGIWLPGYRFERHRDASNLANSQNHQKNILRAVLKNSPWSRHAWIFNMVKRKTYTPPVPGSKGFLII